MVGGWTDGQEDGWMGGWMSGQMDGQADGWMDRKMDGRVGGWIVAWTAIPIISGAFHENRASKNVTRPILH